MSRYLTPSRVALLSLIRLYSDGLVPSSACIPILSFVISNILPIRLNAKEGGETRPLDDSIINIEKLQEATCIHHSAIPGRTIWDLLLKNLWGINSLDALHTFFDDLQLLLEPADGSSGQYDGDNSTRPKRMLLSRNSPFGAFVRRSQLEFTRLQFHDGTNLWKRFIVYRGPTLAFWKRRNPAVGSHSFDCNLRQLPGNADGRLTGLIYGDLSHSIPNHASYSTDDMERLIDHQVNRMQQIGVRIPHTVLSQIKIMAESGSVVPEVSYYMQFLEAWKAGDYPSSFDNLHRYFEDRKSVV